MSRNALARKSAGTLSKYDPKKATKKIAFLEMAEKHYAKAKDATKLTEAIRAKLEAQAEFVYWWDTQGPGKEGKGNVPDRGHYSGRDGLPERQVVQRWRSKLNDPDKFEQTFTTACQKYPKLLEFISSPHVSHNSGENEWYTPSEYIEAARAAMGEIDLDPATSTEANAVVKAAEIFTRTENGLEQRWDGRVWLNPPYATPLVGQFAEKLAAEVRAEHVSAAVVLVNNATETQWFRAIADIAAAICFPTGRVRFWSPSKESAAPLQGQAVLYIGTDLEAFASAFADFGFIATVRRSS